MPHVVRYGSHHRIDGVPKGSLEVVPHHPVVGFQVADNRLDSRTLAELLPSFLCQRLYWLIAGKTGYLLGQKDQFMVMSIKLSNATSKMDI